MRIGVAGIQGRMGRLVAEAIVHAGATLAGGTTRGGHPDVGELAALCDVLVDFTTPDATCAHAQAVQRHGIAWVLGTTGLTKDDAGAVQTASRHIAIVQAANFSPGVTLLLAAAERLARALPEDEYDAEILDMHHRQKIDAPSGTALALGRAVAHGRGAALSDIMQAGPLPAGPRATGRIGFACLRGGQVVGEHSLIFAGAAELITLSHSALDRSVFARGAVRAALWAGQGRQPGLYSMRDVLGLTGNADEELAER